MSLFRSASGPGGLSINTGAANSLAPPASQPANTGGLFGSSTAAAGTTSAPATAAPAMTSTGTSLFGGQKTGGLFGASTTTNTAAPATGGGLFGNASTTQQTPKLGGSLFGNTQQNTTTTTGTGISTGGGLFGNANTNTQQQQGTTGGGLFGQAQNQQQQSTGGGLFGNASTTTNTQTGSTGGGLFGQSSGGGLLGQTQPQQMQQPNNSSVSAVQVNYDNLRPRSRFDDLAKPIQDEIALIDKGIQRVIKMKDEIGEFMPQHERDIDQLGRDVKFVESKFRSVQVALHRDVQTVKTLQDMTKKNIADAQLSFKATDNLKLPTHYHNTGLFATATSGPSSDSRSGATGANGDSSAAATHASAQDLITYFNRVCDNVEKYKRRLDDYRSEIERDMPGVEHGLYEQIRAFRDRNASAAAAASAGGVRDQLGQVLSALRELGNAIIGQAGQIADTRERLSRLQAGIIDSGVYAAGLTA